MQPLTAGDSLTCFEIAFLLVRKALRTKYAFRIVVFFFSGRKQKADQDDDCHSSENINILRGWQEGASGVIKKKITIDVVLAVTEEL